MPPPNNPRRELALMGFVQPPQEPSTRSDELLWDIPSASLLAMMSRHKAPPPEPRKTVWEHLMEDD